MKRYIIILLLLMAGVVSGSDQMARGAGVVVNADDMWNRANTAYVNGDFNGAITIYDSIHRSGMASYKLYYNMGNAYFKTGQIGKSILFYNRAQMLAPSDKDVSHNLRIANGYVKDKIDVVPEFFLKKWMRSVRRITGSDGWAVMSIVFFALMLTMVGVYLLGRNLMERKVGFYGGVVGVMLFLTSFGFAMAEKKALLNSQVAVVMSAATAVKSSPDSASKDIFVLHEGTKVKVVSRLGDWREVQIADGNKGWLPARTIETLR